MSAHELAQDRPGRHAVILCHPDKSSFNHSIATAYCDTVRANGQDVILRDLYAIGFDPVLKASERPDDPGYVRSADVATELDLIRGSDIFVLIYPIWFGSPPAMMKGYIERVLGSGVGVGAVEHGVRSETLGSKRLLSFSTSGLGSVGLNEQGQETALRDLFGQYLAQGFGMHSQEHTHFSHITAALSERFAGQYLLDVVERAHRSCAQVKFGDEALLHDSSLLRQVSRYAEPQFARATQTRESAR